ncbi:MAG: hypothetical protein J7J19_03210 [Thaumarchaeota archaeon]|nr:hypothetical protein [Nitrososphaerota archaeon]
MILESHGDACRLGYLRLIACLLEDGSQKSFDFLASILYDMLRNLEFYEPLTQKPTGLITRYVNARNYVTLAAEMGFIDRASQTIGEFGKIYLCLDSADKFREFVEGRSIPSLNDLIALNDAEKFFFLWILLNRDYPMIQHVLRWVIDRKSFTRQEAMNQIMEEFYPNSLRKVLSTLDGRRKEQIIREIEEAEGFRKRRLQMDDKVSWIKSSQYAKYRHIAPPRLEWLVDCGILKRVGRGKYEIRESYLKLRTEVLKLTSLKPAKLDNYFFGEFVKLFSKDFSAANRYEILKTMIEVYERLRTLFGDEVNLSTLECSTIMVLMERGKFADLKTIHSSFNSLALKFPDKIYVIPGREKNMNIAYINVEEIEV